MRASDLPRAAEFASRRIELLKRLGSISEEDRGWQQSLAVYSGGLLIFGEDEYRGQCIDSEFSSGFYLASEKIGNAIEAYLRGELLSVEQELRQLDVKIDE